MPLQNGLPLKAFPGNPWSSQTPAQAQELITTWNLDEADALNIDPGKDIAWAKVGTLTSVGTGIVKIFHNMPQRMDYQPFTGTRTYNTVDVVAQTVRPQGFDLNFAYPMVWDQMGNGYKLMSNSTNGLVEFMGINGMAPKYIQSGQHLMAQLVASLFYSGLYSTALSLTTPAAVTYAQPNNPNGIALFTDGLGAEGTPGAKHYANPTMANSARFANVFPAFGAFESTFGASLVKMTQIPHATLSNVTSGATVTDVFGGTGMRDKFFRMMVSDLVMQTTTATGAKDQASAVVAGAAITNPYGYAKTMGITEENFVGTAFGPRRFWILPQLDNHPYLVANPTADFWINVSAAPKRPAWAHLACNSKDFVPTYRFYGAGDPLAQSQKLCRFETDLDGGVAAGDPGSVQMFMSV